MIVITTINTSAKQELNLEGENRESILLTLEYLPRSQSWNMGIQFEGFSLSGIRITNSPNCLRNYKNIIPFGISCTVTDGLDPYFITDFESGRCTLSLLNSTEVEQIEDAYFE